MIGLVLVEPYGAAAVGDQVQPDLLRGGRLAEPAKPSTRISLGSKLELQSDPTIDR